MVKEIGFKEDQEHKGWTPKLGPNDYKCKIVHGFTEKGPVTLTVGPKGAVDIEALKLAGDYFLAKKKHKSAIFLPKVWNVGNYDDRSWVVRKRISGVNFLGTPPFSNDREKEKIAQLYWNTVAVFSAMESKEQTAGDFESFIRERINKWVKLGETCRSRASKRKREIFRNIAENVFRFVFYETDLLESIDPEMELFFRNFGNTDIVVKDGKLYMPSPDIAFFPQFYGAVYFIWNVLMYCYIRPNIKGVIEDMKIWQEIFKKNCPVLELRNKFDTSFCLLLFERVIATLLVDIPLRRSPFDVRGKEGLVRTKKAEKVFVEVLKYLLGKIPTLVKNEPFKDDFASLKKVYKF